MSATGIMTKRGTPWSERIVQASMYIIISGFIIFYGQGWIAGLIEDYSIELPISDDLAISIISIVVGLLISTILLFFLKRSVRKEVRRREL